MKIAHASAIALLLGTAACGHTPRAFTFDTPRGNPEVLNLLAKGLQEDGHKISHVDRQRGEIITYWENTGYRFRETDDLEHETTIFLRYHVSVAPKDNEHRISLTADVQRCAADSAMITPREVIGTCLKMDVILPTHQKVLDKLGQHLSGSLASSQAAPAGPSGG
jgi:hypothetical protein